MMDRDKIDRERENIVEATRQTFQAATENAFTLQERTLEFARGLLESSAEASRSHAEQNRAMFEDLAEQSRRQQEALEVLIRETASAYVDLLWSPFSYYQDALEAMAPSAEESPSPAEERSSPPTEERPSPTPPQDREGDSLPLEDYDSLNIREISERTEDLSVEELEQLRSYEAANKNRSTLLRRLDARIEAGS